MQDAYKHSLVENSTIYRNCSSDWPIWLVMCRLYGRVAAEAKFGNMNASAVLGSKSDNQNVLGSTPRGVILLLVFFFKFLLTTELSNRLVKLPR